MKYPDINIQIKHPNKLINADTPLETQSGRIFARSGLFSKITNWRNRETDQQAHKMAYSYVLIRYKILRIKMWRDEEMKRKPE